MFHRTKTLVGINNSIDKAIDKYKFLASIFLIEKHLIKNVEVFLFQTVEMGNIEKKINNNL